MASVADSFVVYLRTHESAAGVRSTLFAGHAAIIMGSDVDLSVLDQKQKDRGPTTSGTLILAVIDAGSESTSPVTRLNHLLIRLVDRGRGYSGIETTRQALESILSQRPRYNVEPTLGGVIEHQIVAHEGQMYDMRLAAQYTSITLNVHLGGVL